MINRVKNKISTTNLEVPGIRLFSNEVVKYEDGINLTIGEPDFPTPERVKRAGIEAIQQNRTGDRIMQVYLNLGRNFLRFLRTSTSFTTIQILKLSLRAEQARESTQS